MINTYHSSMAPPPVPLRLDRSQALLVPAPLPAPSHSKTLIRFLVAVGVLHLLLSVAGFIYLSVHFEKMTRSPLAEGKVESLSSVKQETIHIALAHMLVDRRTSKISTPGYLEWDMSHSLLRNINYANKSWLTVLQPGDYYVYSKVTFSNSASASASASSPTSQVRLRKSEKGDESVLMKAYCNLGSPAADKSAPRLCTATQGRVVKLEEGSQLSVWIENASMVDYEDGATAFGMYKL